MEALSKKNTCELIRSFIPAVLIKMNNEQSLQLNILCLTSRVNTIL